jgi:hypothetical protein
MSSKNSRKRATGRARASTSAGGAEKPRGPAVPASAASGQTQASQSQHPNRKRLVKGLIWAAGVAGATVITLLLTGVIPSVLNQFVNSAQLKDAIRPGQDIIVNESMYYPDGEGVPLPVVVIGSYRPSAELVRELSHTGAAASLALQNQIRGADGVDVGNVFIRIVLQGNRNETIRILNIYPVDLRRSAPLDGVLFDINGQGEDTNIQMGFNLDQPVPQALNINNPDILTSQPFFEEHTISLADGEQSVLVVQASTTCYSSSFDLAINYMVDGAMRTEILDNDGKPFAVTAYRYSKSGSFSYAEDFELQGNFSVIPVSGRRVPVLPSDQFQKIRAACPYLSSSG